MAMGRHRGYSINIQRYAVSVLAQEQSKVVQTCSNPRTLQAFLDNSAKPNELPIVSRNLYKSLFHYSIF
jgi:hypothetical protein